MNNLQFSPFTKQRRFIAIGIPILIFVSCALITFTTKFKEHTDQLSIGLLLDLLLIAPLAYYLAIRKTAISKMTVLRVFMLGVFVATLLLEKGNSPALHWIKTFIAPIVEFSLIGFIVWKFYAANKKLKAEKSESIDFLIHCRGLLFSVFGNRKLANGIASEVSVFYYLVARRDKSVDYTTKFSTYKQTGVIMVLNIFLFLFVSETIGMHFIFKHWNKTGAWILTGLGIYSCLQLLAHIKSIKARPTLLNERFLLIRSGLLGGDVYIDRNNIERIEITNKMMPGKDVIKLAFIKGLENHSLAIYLKEPVVVTKAFGMQKNAKILLVCVDEHKKFMEEFCN